MSRKIDELDFFLEKASNFVIKNPKIIFGLSKNYSYNDEPKLYGYLAYYASKNKNNENGSSGFSFNKKRALAKVLGEAIERYCLENFKPRINVIGSELSLLSRKKKFISPFKLTPFSTSQLAKKEYKNFTFDSNTKFKWTSVNKLFAIESYYTPAQLFIFNNPQNEQVIIPVVSTGVSLGETLDDSLYRSICEIIERDSFMIAYSNKLTLPIMDLKKSKNRIIKKILSSFERYNLQLVVLDSTTDIGIPSFLSLVIDRTGKGPAVSIGLRAGFDIKNVIIGAIEESLMTRGWIRDKFVYLKPNYKIGKIIETIEDKAYYWFHPDSIEKLNFWIDSKKYRKLSYYDNDSPLSLEDNLNMVKTIFKRDNIDAYYLDITDKNVKNAGFNVTKVIIPKLVPVSLNDKYPYLGSKRLYASPVKMKYFKTTKNEKDINTIPHPFL